MSRKITVTVPPEVKRRLIRLAKQSKVSQSHIVRAAVAAIIGTPAIDPDLINAIMNEACH